MVLQFDVYEAVVVPHPDVGSGPLEAVQISNILEQPS